MKLRTMNKVKLERICKHVQQVFQVDLEGLRSSSRAQVFIDARMALSVIARKNGYKFDEIGCYINRDHAAVMSLCKVYELLTPKAPKDKALLEKIREVRHAVEREKRTIYMQQDDCQLICDFYKYINGIKQSRKYDELLVISRGVQAYINDKFGLNCSQEEEKMLVGVVMPYILGKNSNVFANIIDDNQQFIKSVLNKLDDMEGGENAD